MKASCAQEEAVCHRLKAALKKLTVRLQRQYEEQMPGQGFRIRQAIEEAEAAAWRTPFPDLFLPDLAEEAVARINFFKYGV